MKKNTLKFKNLTEFWCEKSYKKTLYYNRLKEGNLTKLQAAQFHYNAEIVIQNTLESMKEASFSSKKMGHTDLSIFFDLKVKEESGHDKWAKNDYLKLNLTDSEKSMLTLTEGALKLVNKLHHMARFSPFSMLAYVFFGEYHVTIVGPEVADLYSKAINEKTVLIDSHAKLDLEHVEDDLEALNQLMKEGTVSDQARKDLIMCMNYQIEFYNELCALADITIKESHNEMATAS